MSDSIQHPWDIRCPFCVGRDFDDILEEESLKDKEKDRVEKARSKISGSEKTVSVPEHTREDMREVPKWVDLSLQPSHIQERLKISEKQGRQQRNS